MNKNIQLDFSTILKPIVRVSIGAFFIVSAIFKLLSIETFELYIYSFKILNFSLSTVMARFVIAFELLAGALLISKIHYRKAWWLTLIMLVGFSLLLTYTAIFRDDQNCHCMGDIVELKPSLSIIKNIFTILLLLYVKNESDYIFRGKKILFTCLLITSFAIPFVLLPNDNLYNLFAKNKKQINETVFNAFLQDSVMNNINLKNGNHIVGVISSGCEFCRLSAIKISEFAENNHINPDKIMFFVWGDEKSILEFKKETKTEKFRYILIDPIRAINMVNGSFPTYLYVSEEEIVESANLRQMTEKSVIEHLR